MDRNLAVAGSLIMIGGSLSARRAWIEILPALKLIARRRSLSARRAWIEITLPSIAGYLLSVALRKESVDRNKWIKAHYPGCRLSLSARRAWIEICLSCVLLLLFWSLSARRAWIEIWRMMPIS